MKYLNSILDNAYTLYSTNSLYKVVGFSSNYDSDYLSRGTGNLPEVIDHYRRSGIFLLVLDFELTCCGVWILTDTLIPVSSMGLLAKRTFNSSVESIVSERKTHNYNNRPITKSLNSRKR